jgi:hypothetical protein
MCSQLSDLALGVANNASHLQGSPQDFRRRCGAAAAATERQPPYAIIDEAVPEVAWLTSVGLLLTLVGAQARGTPATREGPALLHVQSLSSPACLVRIVWRAVPRSRRLALD